MENKKVFANGFSFSRRDNAPDFVIGELGVKMTDAIETIKQYSKKNKDGEMWLNLKINISRGGNPYVEVDTFVPDSSKKKNPIVEKAKAIVEEDDFEDLPF